MNLISGCMCSTSITEESSQFSLSSIIGPFNLITQDKYFINENAKFTLYVKLIFSRVLATLQPALSVGR